MRNEAPDVNVCVKVIPSRGVLNQVREERTQIGNSENQTDSGPVAEKYG